MNNFLTRYVDQKLVEKYVEREIAAGKRTSDFLREITTKSNLYDETTSCYNPSKLAQRKGFRVYKEMMLDDLIQAAIELHVLSVLADGHTVVAASDDPQDTMKKEFIEYNFEQMTGTIETGFEEAMSYKKYGFSMQEIKLKMDDKKYRGKLILDKLILLNAEHIQPCCDERNVINPEFFKYNGVTFPKEKFLHFVNKSEYHKFFGKSDLDFAYRSWFGKDNLIKFMNIYMERHAMPIAMGIFDSSKANPAASKDQTLLEAILKNFSAKTTIVMPKGVEVKLLESVKKAQADYIEALKFHNDSIQRALMVMKLMGIGESESGSLAQSKTQDNIFTLVINKQKRYLAEQETEQLIRKLIDINFPGTQFYPTLKFNPRQMSTAEQLELILKALEKKAIHLTFEDKNVVRNMVGLESIAQEDEVPDLPEEPEDTFALKASRPKTKFEKRINLTVIDKELNDIEDNAVNDLAEVLNEQKQILINTVIKKINRNELTTQFIKGLTLKKMSDVNNILGEMIGRGFDGGEKVAEKEVGLDKFAIVSKTLLKPRKVLQILDAKKIQVSGVINNDLLEKTRTILYNGIQKDLPTSKMIEQIEEVYKPYVGDPTSIVNGKVVSPGRIKTIVNTNLNDVFNTGKYTKHAKLVQDDFIIGYQFSEIMDDKTTEISKYVDDKIISTKHPRFSELKYPLHFNDRGMAIAVTRLDAPVKFMTDAEVNRAISLKGARFK